MHIRATKPPAAPPDATKRCLPASPNPFLTTNPAEQPRPAPSQGPRSRRSGRSQGDPGTPSPGRRPSAPPPQRNPPCGPAAPQRTQRSRACSPAAPGRTSRSARPRRTHAVSSGREHARPASRPPERPGTRLKTGVTGARPAAPARRAQPRKPRARSSASPRSPPPAPGCG